jgi:hypothetical protein
MGDVSIDTVISHIDMEYLVTLAVWSVRPYRARVNVKTNQHLAFGAIQPQHHLDVTVRPAAHQRDAVLGADHARHSAPQL